MTIHRPLIPMVFCHILNDGSTVLSRSVMSDSLRPMGGSLIGSSVQGILQARILNWVAISFSRGSSWSKDQTWVSCSTGRFFFFFFFAVVWITFIVHFLLVSFGQSFFFLSFSYIVMNQPWIYMYSPSWSPLPPPSLPDPSGSSQCTRSKHLSHASNLGWLSVSP